MRRRTDPFIRKLPLGQLQTNCYLFSADAEHLFIIDPADQPDSIIAAAQESGMKPAGIILTHTHFDHILACSALKEYFKDIRIHVHTVEAAMLGASGSLLQEQQISHLVPGMLGYAKGSLKGLPEATDLLQDAQIIDLAELQVVHTPGHTPGSVCLYHEGFRLLFSGDTLFYHSVGRTDFAGGDHELLQESLNRLTGLLDDDIRVYPGHGQDTTIGEERTCNPFIAS